MLVCTQAGFRLGGEGLSQGLRVGVVDGYGGEV